MSDIAGLRGVIVHRSNRWIQCVNVDDHFKEVEIIEYIQYEGDEEWFESHEKGITLTLDAYRAMTAIVSKELGI